MISKRLITTAGNNSLERHVSIIYDDMQRWIRALQVAIEPTHTCNRPVRRGTNVVIKSRQRQHLDVVHDARHAGDSFYPSLGVRTCRRTYDLSGKSNVAAVDAVCEIVEHAVIRECHQLAPHASA